MNWSVFFAVALLSVTSTYAAEDDINAVRAHMECICRNRASVDNGGADVRAIAEKIAPLCRNEHIAAMLASLGEEWKATPPDKARQLELDHTQAAVLYCRAQTPKP